VYIVFSQSQHSVVFEVLELRGFMNLDRLSFDLQHPFYLVEFLPLDYVCNIEEHEDSLNSSFDFFTKNHITNIIKF